MHKERMLVMMWVNFKRIGSGNIMISSAMLHPLQNAALLPEKLSKQITFIHPPSAVREMRN